MKNKGKLIIFSAPSGTGKSTIINWLMQEHRELNMAFSISCTSRAPRGTEKHGVEYFFLTPEEFRSRIEADEFLEYELRRRLESRGTDAPEVIDQRIARAEFEIGFADKFDKQVVNDNLDKAKNEVLKIIKDFLTLDS